MSVFEWSNRHFNSHNNRWYFLIFHSLTVSLFSALSFTQTQTHTHTHAHTYYSCGSLVADRLSNSRNQLFIHSLTSDLLQNCHDHKPSETSSVPLSAFHHCRAAVLKVLHDIHCSNKSKLGRQKEADQLLCAKQITLARSPAILNYE